MLPRAFYARPAVEVARGLLGKVLRQGGAAGRIIETEAYLGIGDAAAHSAREITPRTRVLFGPPGHIYVYLIYGLHRCLNISPEIEGVAGCVLIRAREPIAGITGACDGPGELTHALGITLRHNGADVTHGPITISEPDEPRPVEIAVSRRIGITKAADLPLRFTIRERRH